MPLPREMVAKEAGGAGEQSQVQLADAAMSRQQTALAVLRNHPERSTVLALLHLAYRASGRRSGCTLTVRVRTP